MTVIEHLDDPGDLVGNFRRMKGWRTTLLMTPPILAFISPLRSASVDETPTGFQALAA